MGIKIYLAGDISRERWRLKVIEALKDCNIDWLSPIDNISYSYQSLCKIHPVRKTFHIADKMKIDKSDIVFAYFRDGSPSFFSGASWECGYGHGKCKHIIVVNDMPASKECKYEFVKRMADSYYRSLEEGIEHLKELIEEMEFLPKE